MSDPLAIYLTPVAYRRVTPDLCLPYDIGEQHLYGTYGDAADTQADIIARTKAAATNLMAGAEAHGFNPAQPYAIEVLVEWADPEDARRHHQQPIPGYFDAVIGNFASKEAAIAAIHRLLIIGPPNAEKAT